LAQRALGDSDANVRRIALAVLREMQPDVARERVPQLLHDDDTDVRAHAARAAGELDPPSSAGALVRLLGDSNSAVRAQAAAAAGRLGIKEAVVPLIKLLSAGYRADDFAAAKERHAAVVALGRLGDARALPALEAASRDDQSVTVWDEHVAEAARAAIEAIRSAAS
jgi:HEAT repeat protein